MVHTKVSLGSVYFSSISNGQEFEHEVLAGGHRSEMGFDGICGGTTSAAQLYFYCIFTVL